MRYPSATNNLTRETLQPYLELERGYGCRSGHGSEAHSVKHATASKRCVLRRSNHCVAEYDCGGPAHEAETAQVPTKETKGGALVVREQNVLLVHDVRFGKHFHLDFFRGSWLRGSTAPMPLHQDHNSSCL